MALRDFIALIDEKLHDVFVATAPDPSKARKPVLKAIERAKAQFEAGKQPRGDSKWWSANNNVVHFTPNIDGKPLDFGKRFNTIPAERFVQALDHLRDAVEKGELDEMITSEGSTRAKPVSATAGKKRAGWSDERKAKFAATQAAKKAAAK